MDTLEFPVFQVIRELKVSRGFPVSQESQELVALVGSLGIAAHQESQDFLVIRVRKVLVDIVASLVFLDTLEFPEQMELMAYRGILEHLVILAFLELLALVVFRVTLVLLEHLVIAVSLEQMVLMACLAILVLVEFLEHLGTLV